MLTLLPFLEDEEDDDDREWHNCLKCGEKVYEDEEFCSNCGFCEEEPKE